jgi:hypothetical protein
MTTDVKVTVPVGATPELPVGGFTDVCVSTRTVTEKTVFAPTVVGADENDECVWALVIVIPTDTGPDF